jgi:DNA-directed RNA polymerase specialized sigma24 family protein
LATDNSGEPMHPHRQPTTNVPFLLNAADHLGRTIDPSVLSVAEEIGPGAVRYAEKVLGDPALAISLFEETAATVSQTLREKAANGKPDVTDIRGYLFLAYMRRVRRQKRMESVLNDPNSLLFARQAEYTDVQDMERSLFLAEALASCDKVTQNIVLRRLEGYSWKEIEGRCGVSSSAARKRFSSTVQRLRKALHREGREL